MSLNAMLALQAAVHQRLTGDPALTALIGTAVYDAPPPGAVPDIYVALGATDLRDRSDGSGGGGLHRFTLSVISQADGFAMAKSVAAAIGAALSIPLPALAQGHLVGLWFERAQARRSGSAGQIRRIDLTFAARVSDT